MTVSSGLTIGEQTINGNEKRITGVTAIAVSGLTIGEQLIKEDEICYFLQWQTSFFFFVD